MRWSGYHAYATEGSWRCGLVKEGVLCTMYCISRTVKACVVAKEESNHMHGQYIHHYLYYWHILVDVQVDWIIAQRINPYHTQGGVLRHLKQKPYLSHLAVSIQPHAIPHTNQSNTRLSALIYPWHHISDRHWHQSSSANDTNSKVSNEKKKKQYKAYRSLNVYT